MMKTMPGISCRRRSYVGVLGTGNADQEESTGGVQLQPGTNYDRSTATIWTARMPTLDLFQTQANTCEHTTTHAKQTHGRTMCLFRVLSETASLDGLHTATHAKYTHRRV